MKKYAPCDSAAMGEGKETRDVREAQSEARIEQGKQMWKKWFTTLGQKCDVSKAVVLQLS
jgi:hypothetical protein